MPKDTYEVVAFHEGAAFDKVKNWAKDKSGYNQLYNAGLNKKHGERLKDIADRHRFNASTYDSLERAEKEKAGNTDGKESFDHSAKATEYAIKAGEERRTSMEHRAKSDDLFRASNNEKDFGTASMRKIGRNAGSLGGAALGAAAGKGYSVYKRHQMKKRGATKKELAEHKKGDLKRMIKGAGVGAAIGGVGGHVGGSHYAKAIYKRAYEESEPYKPK